MAVGRGGKGKVLVDNAAGTPVDLTPWTDNVDWGAFSSETLESTVFGQNSKTYIPSLNDGTVGISGKYDAATGGPDVTLRGLRGNGPLTVEWQPEGAGAGKPFRRVEAILTSYAASAPVGGIISFTATWQASGDETTGALV